MKYPVRIAALALLAPLVALVPSAPADVVLLHNGSLLEGSVQRLPDEVILKQPGGVIRLRATEVAQVSTDAIAVYEWLRKTRIGPRGSSEEHLALAGWAIDNRLWPQAARELLDARQVNPNSRRLAVLERRFDELTRPKPVASEPRRDTAVLVASYEAPVEPTRPTETPLPRMPESSVEFFTRRVQPVLRHGCATAGCHRGGETDRFPLDPSWLRGHADSRSTDRNLRATLAEIDMGSPANSRLLHAATGPHHGATPVSGPRREEVLAKLSAWVHAVASLNPVDLPPPPASSGEMFRGAGGEVFEPSQEAMPGVALAEPQDSFQRDTQVTPATFQVAPPVRGGQVRRVGPRDEFDPAIFNERFRRPEDDLPASPR